MAEDDDPVAAERSACHAAIRAAEDASSRVVLLNHEPGMPDLPNARTTLQDYADCLVEVIVTHDRLIERGEAVGMDAESVARLRERRAAQALQVQRVRANIETIESAMRDQPPG